MPVPDMQCVPCIAIFLVYNINAEGIEIDLEEVITGAFEAGGDGIGFPGEDGSVELQVAGGFRNTDIGRDLVAGSDLNDVAGDEFSSGNRMPIPISQNGDLSRQHARDGRNNTTRTPILLVRSSIPNTNPDRWDPMGKRPATH
jgi:hypothetical protein